MTKEPSTAARMEAAFADVAQPVAWQARTDLSGPYSSLQGWTDWRFCDKQQFDLVQYYRAQGKTNCEARGLYAAPQEPAATELLAACKDLISYCDKHPPMGDSLWCVQQIRAAIAPGDTK